MLRVFAPGATGFRVELTPKDDPRRVRGLYEKTENGAVVSSGADLKVGQLAEHFRRNIGKFEGPLAAVVFPAAGTAEGPALGVGNTDQLPKFRPRSPVAQVKPVSSLQEAWDAFLPLVTDKPFRIDVAGQGAMLQVLHVNKNTPAMERFDLELEWLLGDFSGTFEYVTVPCPRAKLMRQAVTIMFSDAARPKGLSEQDIYTKLTAWSSAAQLAKSAEEAPPETAP